MDDEWLTDDDQLTHFSKAREKIVGRVKGSELQFVQGPQSSEEDIVAWKSNTSSTGMTSIREPGTNWNHVPIGKAQNYGSSDSQEIPVSMDKVSPEETEDQSVTSPSGEALGRNVHVRRFKRIRNDPQRYNPVFGTSREWNNDADASIVYMIQDRDLNRNVDTDDII